jgi:hypothetical protein
VQLYGPSVELSVFVGTTAYKYADLHIDFNVMAHRRSKPNTGQFTIYNLSESSRNLFNEEGRAIEFKAGYAGQLNTIFRGTLKNVRNQYTAPDWTTILFSGDGQKKFDEAIFSKTYSQGTAVETIVKDLALNLGLPSEIEVGSPGYNQSLLYSASYSGKTKDVLDTVCRDYGLEWSIQYGVLEVRPYREPRSKDTTAVLLTSQTGMIGSPTVTEKGVKVKSLLNPEIRPGRLIKIDSKSTIISKAGLDKKDKVQSANGTFICDVCNFSGNNYGGDFAVEIEAYRR